VRRWGEIFKNGGRGQLYLWNLIFRILIFVIGDMTKAVEIKFLWFDILIKKTILSICWRRLAVTGYCFKRPRIMETIAQGIGVPGQGVFGAVHRWNGRVGF